MRPEDYPHTIPPFEHQEIHLGDYWEEPAWGLLWEQGTAKTKPVIDTAVMLYLNGKIDGMVVIAPPGVERNWKSDEFPKHLPVEVSLETRIEVFLTKRSKTKYHSEDMAQLVKHKGFAVLLMSYNAFMTEVGKKVIWKFLRHRRCLYVLDESHNIKNPAGKRSRAIVKSSKYAPFRRILTGTPVAVGPFDLYSQIKFLDNHFWERKGIYTFSAFKKTFGVWLTAEAVLAQTGIDPGFDRLIEYKDIPLLKKWLAEISDRKLKEDVLDLPSKLYSKRYMEMDPGQKAIYEEIKSEYMYEFDDGQVIDADLALVRLLRLQQITCGYVPSETEEPVRLLGNKNPRLKVMEDISSGIHHQAIVWARFREDINQIMDLLGKKAVRYDGSIDGDEAERNKEAFQAGDVQWFVGTAQKGGPGLTLHMAKTTVYYSNSFKLIDRLQSEDRNHRAGMDDQPVNYIDIICPDSVDEHIVENLKGKVDIASQITGDELRSWI